MGATRGPGGPLGVNSFAVGFNENSLALGLRVDFFALSLFACPGGLELFATGVVGCPGDTGCGVVGPAGSAAGVPGWGDGRGVPPTLPPVFTDTVGVVACGGAF